MNAPVDRPPAGCVDETVPIDEFVSALQIQGDVIEPCQPSKAVREQQRFAPIRATDQGTIGDCMPVQMQTEVSQFVFGSHHEDVRRHAGKRLRLRTYRIQIEHVGPIAFENPPVQLDGNRSR